MNPGIGLLRIIIAVAVICLAGCATAPIASPMNSDAKVSGSKGILLVSVTVDMDRQVQDGWFYFRRKGAEDETRLAAFGLAGLIKKPNDYAGGLDRRGRLLALPLQPGEYELCSWTLYIAQLGGYGYITPKVRPHPYSFMIYAGTVTYVGNLHIDTALGRNVFGVRVPFGALPNISDQQAIDIPILKTKYPDLTRWPLRVAVPDGKAWRDL